MENFVLVKLVENVILGKILHTYQNRIENNQSSYAKSYIVSSQYDFGTRLESCNMG